MADDADALALGDVEVHIGENPFLRIELLPKAEDDLLQLIVLMAIELKRLADAAAANDEIRRHRRRPDQRRRDQRGPGGQKSTQRGRRRPSEKLNDRAGAYPFVGLTSAAMRGSR